MWLSLPLQSRYTVPPILVVLFISLVFLMPNDWQELLVYSRHEIASGDWWRVVSGQWIHLRTAHLIMNLLGLVVIWLFFAEYLTARYFLPAALVVSIGCMWATYLWAPEIELYVGFSGTLYGLFAWGASRDVLLKKSLGWMLLLIVAAKVTYDYFVGPVSLGGAAVDDLATPTHLFGVLIGIAWATAHFVVSEKAPVRDSSAPNS